MNWTEIKIGLCTCIAIIMLATTGMLAHGREVTGFEVAKTVPNNIKRQFYDNITSSTTLEFDITRDLGNTAAGTGWITNNSGQSIDVYLNYHRDPGATMNPIPVPDGLSYKIERSDPAVGSIKITSSGDINVDIEISK